MRETLKNYVKANPHRLKSSNESGEASDDDCESHIKYAERRDQTGKYFFLKLLTQISIVKKLEKLVFEGSDS